MPDSARTAYRREALTRWFAAGIFFASALPFVETPNVLGEPLRLWVWGVALAIVWATRARWANPQSQSDSD